MTIVNYYREAISDIILDEFSLKNADINNISFESLSKIQKILSPGTARVRVLKFLIRVS